MKHDDSIAKAEKERIDARLQEARAKLDGLAATAKEKKAQAEIDAIAALKAKRDEIHTRLQELSSAGDAKASQIKAEVEAKLASFETEVTNLAARLKAHSTHQGSHR